MQLVESGDGLTYPRGHSVHTLLLIKLPGGQKQDKRSFDDENPEGQFLQFVTTQSVVVDPH